MNTLASIVYIFLAVLGTPAQPVSAQTDVSFIVPKSPLSIDFVKDELGQAIGMGSDEKISFSLAHLEVELEADIEHGSAIQVDWGDSTAIDTVTDKEDKKRIPLRHAYSLPENYTATVIVIDDERNEATLERPVRVVGPESAIKQAIVILNPLVTQGDDIKLETGGHIKITLTPSRYIQQAIGYLSKAVHLLTRGKVLENKLIIYKGLLDIENAVYVLEHVPLTFSEVHVKVIPMLTLAAKSSVMDLLTQERTSASNTKTDTEKITQAEERIASGDRIRQTHSTEAVDDYRQAAHVLIGHSLRGSKGEKGGNGKKSEPKGKKGSKFDKKSKGKKGKKNVHGIRGRRL